MAEVYNPSPFGGVQSPYQPNPYQRYEPYQGNQLAQWASTIASAVGLQGFGDPGVIDTGVNRQINLYGNIQYQQQTKQHSQALMRSYEADTELFLRQAKGAYVRAGYGDQYTEQTQQALLDAHNMFGGMAGLMDDPKFLRTYDLAHGGRTRMPLANAIDSPGMRGYQPGLYRDPAQAGQRAANLASSIQQEFFAGGDPTDFTRSSGLKSYQMAEMYQALNASGKMPDLEKAGSGGDPRLKKWSDKDAGRKANDTLKEYAMVLGTLNEIFTAEGRANTPMNELLQAADTLTGGLQQMSRKSATARIRTLYESANQLGLGSEAVLANLQGANAIAQGYGINEAFAMPMAQYGFEFQKGIRGIENAESWGLKNKDELMVMAQSSQARFVASQGGNRIGMLQRLAGRKWGDASGRIDASKITGTDPTSTALRALATGEQNSPELAALLAGGDREFLNRAAGAFGMSTSTAALEQAMTTQNQEAVHKWGLERQGTGMQRTEFGNLFLQGGGAFGRALDVMTGEMFKGSKAGRALSVDLTKTAGKALQNMSLEELNDANIRKAKMAAAMQESLEAKAKAGDQGAQQMLARLGGMEGGLTGQLQAVAERQYGMLENDLINKGISSSTLNNTLSVLNKGVAADVQESTAKNAVNAQVKSMGLGRIDPGGIFARLATQMAKAGVTEKGDATSAVREALGQDVSGAQAKRLADMVRQLQTEEEKLQKLDEQLATAKPSEVSGIASNKTALLKAIGAKKEEFEAELAKSTDKSVIAAIEDAKKNKTDNAAGKEEDKLSAGGKGGTVHIDSVTLVIDGDDILKNAKVVKQNSKGTGPTPK